MSRNPILEKSKTPSYRNADFRRVKIAIACRLISCGIVKGTRPFRVNPNSIYTIGTINWTTFNLKFKLKAEDKGLWSFIDPGTINDDLPEPKKKLTDAEFQKKVLQVLQLLISHLHDDIIWVVNTAPKPDDPKSAVWQSLSAQFGHSRLDIKTEIKKVERIRMSRNDTEAILTTTTCGPSR
jgi:hypothetical protein